MRFERLTRSDATRKVGNVRVKRARIRQKMLDEAHSEFGYRRDIQKAERENARKSLDAKVDVRAQTAEVEADAKLSAAQKQVKKGENRGLVGRVLAAIGTGVPLYWIIANWEVSFNEKQIIPGILMGSLFVALNALDLFLRNSKEKNYVNAIELARKAEDVLDKAVNEAQKMAEKIMPSVNCSDLPRVKEGKSAP